MTQAGPAASSNPLQGLYDFARTHVLIANSVIAASTTVVGLLDFFAPKLSILPRLIYASTAALVALMILAALSPRLARVVIRQARGRDRAGAEAPLWRRPVWQFTTALLLAVSGLGFISVAKASSGGALASTFEGARSLQIAMLGLQEDARSIKTGVDDANRKLDIIVERVDPINPADRCPDIDCAVTDGASRAAIERLLAKGQKLPDGFVLAGAMAHLIKERSPARLWVADIYIDAGLGGIRFPYLSDMLGAPKRFSDLFIQEYDRAVKGGSGSALSADAAREAWGAFNSCVLKTAGGFTFAQIAILAGDEELYKRASQRLGKSGAVQCEWAKSHPAALRSSAMADADLALKAFGPP